MESLVKRRFLSELRQIDWSFNGASHNGAFAAIHWYPARFIPEIPGTLLGYFSNEGETVLDPFCGSGTTLTEAMRLRRRSIGIDFNPVATMIARARSDTSPGEELALEFGRLKTEIDRLSAETLLCTRGPMVAPETVLALDSDVELPSDELRAWYAAGTLRDLDTISRALRLWNPDDSFRLLASVCFSSVLRRLSSQDAHWGYVCDNVKPKRLVEKDAIAAFYERLHTFLLLRNRFLGLCFLGWIRKKHNRPIVITGDANAVLSTMGGETVDLVVTSPPYLNVTDYINSQRLSFLWLAEYDKEGIRPKEIGARYKRFRKDSLSEYVQMMRQCVRELVRLLKSGRMLVLVLGQSKSHPDYIDQLTDICEAEGLKLIDRLGRTISLQRTLAPSLRDEEILLYRKAK